MTATLKTSRRVAFGAAGLVTLGVAAWLALQLLPRSEQPKVDEGIGEEPSAIEAAMSLVNPPDPATSLLGTASSISPDPLELVLVATSPGHTSREGTASLGTDPRNPQTYAAGASLVNGAVLIEIHRDHVVLELDGRRSVLAVGGKTMGRRLAQFAASSDQAALTVGGADVVSRPLDTVATSREDLSDIIRPQPFYERDEIVGIKILPGRNSSRLAVLGLQSGDVIRTVDGKPLRSVDTGWKQIDDALSTGTSIVVSIERDGNMMFVFLDGSKLAQDPVPMSASTPLPGLPGTLEE